jgi:hypothetical protein
MQQKDIKNPTAALTACIGGSTSSCKTVVPIAMVTKASNETTDTVRLPYIIYRSCIYRSQNKTHTKYFKFKKIAANFQSSAIFELLYIMSRRMQK